MALLMLLVLSLLFLSTCSNFSGVVRVTEEEIKSLGLNCDKETYSCTGNSSSKTCRCDPQCALYGDCCFDSPHRKSMNLMKNIFQCRPIYYFEANKCPTEWSEEKTRYYCEKHMPSPTNITEVILNARIVSVRSGIMYKNLYCAKCNRDTDNLKLLPIVLVCNLSRQEEDITLDRLRYNQLYSQFGVWQKNSDETISFSPCRLMSNIMLEKLTTRPRSCIPAIDKCPPNWADTSVKEKCESYEGIVVVDKRSVVDVYRNVHCAVCNYVDLKKASCFVPHVGGAIEPANFVKIFRFNPSGYEESSCQRGQAYDPFLQRCHDLTCLPFQQRRNSKCI